MLLPVTRPTANTAAPAGEHGPLQATGPGAAEAAPGFSQSLQAAAGTGPGEPAAAGTGLPPAGNGLPELAPESPLLPAELPGADAMYADLPVLPAAVELVAAESVPEAEPSAAALALLLPAAIPETAAVAPANAAPAAETVLAANVAAAAGGTPTLAAAAAAVRGAQRAAGPGLPDATGIAPGRANLPPGAAAAEPLPVVTELRAVDIRDAAGRAELAPGVALQALAGRERTTLESAAGVEWLRADADTALVRAPQPLPLTTGGLPLPASAAPAAASAPATPVPALPLAVNDPGWGDALAERVQILAGQRVQSADIRLNPAELGPLRVEIRVEDGAAHVSFHAQHAATRDAIEQALPRLRELFANEGLSLTGTSVGEQGVRQERDGGGNSAAGPRGAGDTEAGDDAANPAGGEAPRASRGLVDTFA